MIAQLRVCLVSVHETFEELSMKFLQSLPKGYARLDIVADTYRKASIKSSERRKRGSSAKILIGSIKSKVPRDMNKFMVNDENKTSLIKLIFNFIIDQKEQVLRMLKMEMLILSGDDESFTVTVDMIRENQDLRSNQEEADTKVILHTMNILEEGFTVVLHSPSGETDIMVLALALISSCSELGADWEMTDEVVLALEKYVCALYRSKNNSVNELRYELFLKKQKKEGKVIDLAAVRPCFSSLYLQIKRANCVSKIWKSTATPQLSLPPMEKHGWNADGSIMWITETYPEDVSELLINDEDDSESESESAIDIDNESDIISDC